MAQNVIGCSRSQITSEVQFGVYQKTQCSSNTNWTAVERRRLKLTMQLLGDLERERVNSTTQLIFKAHLKMIFCCSFATGRIAPVAIFCPAALNSVLQPPISQTTARYRGKIFPRWSLRRDKDGLISLILQNFNVKCMVTEKLNPAQTKL